MTHREMDVGVIGVGSMGQHHARVYSEISDVNLVAVSDVDEQRAETIARKHNTKVLERDDLLKLVDAVSVVVPTQYHYEIVTTCLDAGVATLVENPSWEISRERITFYHGLELPMSQFKLDTSSGIIPS